MLKSVWPKPAPRSSARKSKIVEPLEKNIGRDAARIQDAREMHRLRFIAARHHCPGWLIRPG